MFCCWSTTCLATLKIFSTTTLITILACLSRVSCLNHNPHQHVVPNRTWPRYGVILSSAGATTRSCAAKCGAAQRRGFCVSDLNRANVEAVVTIRVLHVGVMNGRQMPCHDVLMLPRHSCHSRTRARTVRGCAWPLLPMRTTSEAAFDPPEQQGVLGGGGGALSRPRSLLERIVTRTYNITEL